MCESFTHICLLLKYIIRFDATSWVIASLPLPHTLPMPSLCFTAPAPCPASCPVFASPPLPQTQSNGWSVDIILTVFSRGYISRWEALSVRPSIRLSFYPSAGPSVSVTHMQHATCHILEKWRKRAFWTFCSLSKLVYEFHSPLTKKKKK